MNSSTRPEPLISKYNKVLIKDGVFRYKLYIYNSQQQIPLISQKNIVEVVIDMEQFLCDLLIGHTGDELYYPLLHGPAGPV